MKKTILIGAVGATLALAACSDGGDAGSGENYPEGPVTMTAPADPGSGWDLTIRSLVETLQQEGLVETPLPVENRPGAAGAVFLEQMVNQYEGADDQVAVTSLAMMTNEVRGQSEYGHEDVTMVAGLASEYYVVVTSADSEYDDLESLLEAVAQDPGSVPIGAAADDQLPFGLLIDAAGGDATQANFIAYEGGGEQSAALLSGDIDVAIAGTSEFLPLIESGELDGLAVIADEPLEGLPDVPTATEQGYDVTIANWRGIYGPPGMPDYAVEYWRDTLEQALETDTWREAAEANQWTTTFMVGEEFQTYLDDTKQQVEDAFEKTGQQ